MAAVHKAFVRQYTVDGICVAVCNCGTGKGDRWVSMRALTPREAKKMWRRHIEAQPALLVDRKKSSMRVRVEKINSVAPGRI